MPERFPFTSAVTHVRRIFGRLARTPVAVLMAIAIAVGVAACTEDFTGGDACPSLCPSKPLAFRDTIIDAVTIDSTLPGFPELGLSSALLLATRGDTLVTRGVIRFDVLPTSYLPNKGTTSESITAVDSVVLTLALDTAGALGTTAVTVEAFDVDTTKNDSSSVVVKSLFRADRKLGSVSVVPKAAGDTLRIPLSKTVLAAKIASGSRLRVGLRITGGNGQLRILAFRSGVGLPYVRFDPSTDTTYVPLTFRPTTTFDVATTDVNLAYQVYSLVDKGSPPPEATTLIVGGYPAYRSYLRFALPRFISDSSTIVRAEVIITQRPSKFGNVSDSVGVLPMVPTTTSAVTDLRRILDLSADGGFAALDSTRLVPRDSGQRALNILALARSWRSLPTDVPRAVAFRISDEGAQPAELRFFNSKAAAGLRPRLRITYQPRSESAIP